MASALGRWQPVIGGPVFGIVLGLITKSAISLSASFQPGIRYTSKRILQLSIILLGTTLSVGQVIITGRDSLPVMLGTLVVCLLAAVLFGRWLNISKPLTTLIGVGTAICGASAIAAVAPVIDSEEQEVAYAISTIFLFNVVAVLVFPAVGHALSMGQNAFGLWAGTAVNDTSSVVAAAYSFGEQAGLYATVVKLTRSTMIIPITLGLAGLQAIKAARTSRAATSNVGPPPPTPGHRTDDMTRHTTNETPRAPRPAAHGTHRPALAKSSLIPWFIVWFFVASLLNTFGIIPSAALPFAAASAKFLIVMALSAVGLSADFRQMVRTGYKPLFLGLILWIIVSVSSLLIQYGMGQFG